MKFDWIVIAATTITLACTSSPPCAPIAPHDAGGCGKTFDLDYDPTTQTGCSFVGGTGTSDTCASLCRDGKLRARHVLERGVHDDVRRLTW